MRLLTILILVCCSTPFVFAESFMVLGEGRTFTGTVDGMPLELTPLVIRHGEAKFLVNEHVTKTLKEGSEETAAGWTVLLSFAVYGADICLQAPEGTDCAIEDVIPNSHTKAYRIEGLDYEVTSVLVDPYAATTFLVNGETTPSLAAGESHTFSNGLELIFRGERGYVGVLARAVLTCTSNGDCTSTSVCANGHCTTPDTCVDSDGGQDQYTKGHVLLSSSSDPSTTRQIDDVCINSGKLNEYYCQGGTHQVITISCAKGCLDGTCIPEPTPCSTYTNMEQCLDTTSCFWDQQTSSCKDFPGFDALPPCTDPDNGKNPSVQAHTFGFRNNCANERDCRIRTGGRDACVDDQVREHYCQGGYIVSTMMPCSAGCMNGACVEQEHAQYVISTDGTSRDRTLAYALGAHLDQTPGRQYLYQSFSEASTGDFLDGALIIINQERALIIVGDYARAEYVTLSLDAKTYLQQQAIHVGIMLWSEAKGKDFHTLLNERVGAPAGECHDTDGGNVTTRGTVMVDGMTYTDSCTNNYVTEYFCHQGEMHSFRYYCAAGCGVGACNPQREWVDARPYGSGNPDTLPTVMYRTVRACVDDRPIYKERIFFDNGYTNYVCGPRKQEQCYNDGSFDTWYDEGCEFAETTSTVDRTTCVDTDAGIDIGLFGTVTVTEYYGESSSTGATYEDHCATWDATPGGDAVLYEYYCLPDNSFGRVRFQCPGGCRDGACIPVTEDDGHHVRILDPVHNTYVRGVFPIELEYTGVASVRVTLEDPSGPSISAAYPLGGSLSLNADLFSSEVIRVLAEGFDADGALVTQDSTYVFISRNTPSQNVPPGVPEFPPSALEVGDTFRLLFPGDPSTLVVDAIDMSRQQLLLRTETGLVTIPFLLNGDGSASFTFFLRGRSISGTIMIDAQEITFRDVEYVLVERGQPERPGGCVGCLHDDLCFPFGNRLRVDNVSAFCAPDGRFVSQRETASACENDYECLTNACSNGTCYDVRGELEETRSLLRRIIRWFESWF